MKKFSATASFSILQGSMWGFYAILLGFSSNFLYNYGFKDGHISLLLGIATAISCVVQLGLSELVARIPKITVFKVLMVMGGLMLIGALLMLNGVLDWAAVAGLALGCALLQAIPAMGNAIGMESLNHGSALNYGIARGIGSASYSILALVTGQLVSRFGIQPSACLRRRQP